QPPPLPLLQPALLQGRRGDVGYASVVPITVPSCSWLPPARLPGACAACARTQGAVCDRLRGWSGQRDAMAQRAAHRAGYLREIVLPGLAVLSRIRDDVALVSAGPCRAWLRLPAGLLADVQVPFGKG